MNVGKLTLNWFILVAVVAVIVAWFILYRSRFGQWKPLRIAAAAVFFAVFRAMANIFDSIAFLSALSRPRKSTI